MANKRSLSKGLRDMDFFASNVTFKENGGSNFGSVFGACASLIITMIVAAYRINKFIIMI